MRRDRVALVSLLTLAAPALSRSTSIVKVTSGPGNPPWRRISVVADGPNELPVDVPLLVAAAKTLGKPARDGLSDLILEDAHGDEVPYLLIDPPTVRQMWRSGSILPVLETRDTSGFEVDLGEPLTVDRFRLSGLPAPFLKRVRLEGSGDREHWTLLVPEGTLFDLPDERLRLLELVFTPGPYRYLRLAWDDRRSGRVPAPQSAEARLLTAGAMPLPVTVGVPFERRGSEPGKSRFRIHLPAPRLPLAALVLECGGGHLLRGAHVTEARLENGTVIQGKLGSAALRRTVRADATASDLRIPITAPSESALDLVVDDGDNPPLQLVKVEAELEPLPWIYFEGKAGSTLTAGFVIKTNAPRHYDLEAVRSEAAWSSPPLATWGEPTAAAPAAVQAPKPEVAEGALLDRATFRFSRDITEGPVGLTALHLDGAVLAHSRLSDLRILDGSDHQVPYLFERLDEPLALDLPAPEQLPVPAKRGADEGTTRHVSRYQIELPYPHLPQARVVLHTPARVYERQVRITIARPSPDGRDAPREETVASASWRHSDPELPPPALTLALPDLPEPVATLVIDEGDNTPLPLQSPRLLLPGYRLRFYRRDAKPLTLVYGNDRLGSPQYDLALLAPRLVGVEAHEVWPGAETETPVAEPRGARLGRGLFWAALAVAVLSLLLLIGRLARPMAS